MANLMLFNRDDGFVEGFLRGLRSTFLTDMEYANLKEGGSRGGSDKAKEDFEDLRLTLQETDYGNFLATEVRALVLLLSKCGGGSARVRMLEGARPGSLSTSSPPFRSPRWTRSSLRRARRLSG